jgi:sulfur carrier protein
MRVIANGKERDLETDLTIASFLTTIGWKPDWVVVEHNGEPIERTRFSSVTLRDGDRIEVVRAVAGG